MESQENSEKLVQKKNLIIAFAVLLAFFLISKTLSLIATNPAQVSYEQRCASCHGKDGEGLIDLIPPLANADWLAENQDKLVCLIRYGINDKIIVNGKEYEQQMDGKNLSDIEIHNIVNYINSSWGNDFELTTTTKVIEDLSKCKK